MKIKWKMFVITFLTYSVIHSVRTSWSSMKSFLNTAPYHFNPIFLGSLDMAVLFSLAISLNLFGAKTEKIGPKRFLKIGMCILFGLIVIISILLFADVTVHWLYLVFYSLIGVISCVGWPSCTFVTYKIMLDPFKVF
jgi:sugar phosphate permease